MGNEIKIIYGKCEEVLQTFPDNHFDSVVTDSPYGLLFMGKKWDYQVPSVAQWEEIIRVLKPGGHLLCACGTRTQHRLAVNIEDAGFGIRDVITWHYGSGFPKSARVNLSPMFCQCALSVHNDENTTPLQEQVDRRGMGLVSPDDALLFEDGERLKNKHEDCFPDYQKGYDLCDERPPLSSVGDQASFQQQEYVQEHTRSPLHDDVVDSEPLCTLSPAQYNDHLSSHDFVPPSHSVNEEQENIHKNSKHADTLQFPSGIRDSDPNLSLHKDNVNGFPLCKKCGKPNVDGWGSNLKPATEFWTLARKPLSEPTIAQNVLKHGTGGINIDGCRIEGRERTDYGLTNSIRNNGNIYGVDSTSADFDSNKGRFPANLILDEFAAAELDKQSGISESKSQLMGSGIENDKGNKIYGKYNDIQSIRGHDDTGGASRFFYVAKPSQFERNKGLKGFEMREIYPQNNSIERSEINSTKNHKSQNNHPTVKPIELMRYLVKLVTPKHGICLDPFCGSGTTLIACKLELMNGVGIDMDADHCELAEARVAAWNPERYKEQTLF